MSIPLSQSFFNTEIKEGNTTIPISKGHFNLDTPEREKAFFEKLAHGWEEEYKEYRRLWIELPKKKIVREYPLLVDIELSSACNLSCPMCYTITEEFKKKVKRQFMDLGLFKKIIDEIAGKVYAIRLSLRGESTLHPNFLNAIKYAKEKGIQEISTLTNGSKLTLDFFKKMVDAGIDWISISIDGIGKVYESIRKPLKFNWILENLKKIKEYREKHNLIKPVIKVQTIWPAIRENPAEYYNTFAPLTDLVAFNPLIDYLRKDKKIVYEENFSCPQIYQRLTIGSDGKVLLCANDEEGEYIIGDVNKESVYDIWHGEKINRVRDIHKKPQGFKEIEVCRKCYYPRKTEVSEKAIVNGREILVRNYVGRKQVIGE